jgi:hypothetical protein
MSERFPIRRACIIWDGREGWLQEWREGRWQLCGLGTVATPADLQAFAFKRSMGFLERTQASVAKPAFANSGQRCHIAA